MYMRHIMKWSIRTIKEFDGLNCRKSTYVLMRDERERICEMDITELRKLKEFFDDWQDPFHKDNPDHENNMKEDAVDDDVPFVDKETKPENWKLKTDDYRDIHSEGFTEAICEHGIGHHKGTHGCDGCCSTWPKEISDKVTED